MLPGHVAGHYTDDEIHIDLRRLTLAAGARFIRAAVNGVDLADQEIQFSRPAADRLRPCFAQSWVGAGDGDGPGSRRARDPGEADRPISRAMATTRNCRIPIDDWVVGGGGAGVEIAMALRHRLYAGPGQSSPGQRTPEHRVHLFEAGPDILPAHTQRRDDGCATR